MSSNFSIVLEGVWMVYDLLESFAPLEGGNIDICGKEFTVSFDVGSNLDESRSVFSKFILVVVNNSKLYHGLIFYRKLRKKQSIWRTNEEQKAL